MFCQKLLMSGLCKAAKHAASKLSRIRLPLLSGLLLLYIDRQHNALVSRGCLNVLWLAGTAARDAETVRTPSGQSSAALCSSSERNACPAKLPMMQQQTAL